MLHKLSLFNENKIISKVRSKDRFVLAAFNLFYLANLKKLHENFFILWIDGEAGAAFAIIKTFNRSFYKIPGSELLRMIIKSRTLSKVSILGNCPDNFKQFLCDNDISINKTLSLPNFNINCHSLTDFDNLGDDVIISLPSPKQEHLAKYLFEKGFCDRAYCIGGAIDMIANPKVEAPTWIRRGKLEWIFRLRTDTSRRIKRLLICVLKVISQLVFLIKNVSIVR